MSAIRLDPPSRGVAQRLDTVRWQHVTLPNFSQSRGTSGRRTTQGHADPLHGLVAASRLGLGHVVTGRRLRHVTRRSPSTRAIVSNCTTIEGGSPFHRRSPTSQRELAQKQLSLLKTLLSGCGRPHLPTTPEANHGELLPPRTRGGEDPDRHAESGSHRKNFKSTVSNGTMPDGRHWNILRIFRHGHGRKQRKSSMLPPTPVWRGGGGWEKVTTSPPQTGSYPSPKLV